MYGRMDVWTYGRMDVWTYGRMDRCMLTHTRKDARIGGRRIGTVSPVKKPSTTSGPMPENRVVWGELDGLDSEGFHCCNHLPFLIIGNVASIFV
jgi:hypothetical protein